MYGQSHNFVEPVNTAPAKAMQVGRRHSRQLVLLVKEYISNAFLNDSMMLKIVYEILVVVKWALRIK